jgi:DNA-binding transcriptional LysR family regulator
LFYHVAKAGGISRAVKRIPYGIQQPAVSGQICQLERDIGQRLFERSPFKLTPAGVELLAFVEPFFGGLSTIESRLRANAAPVLRIGAADMALRLHLPAVVERLRRRIPDLRLTLRSGSQDELEAWVEDRSIDLAVAPLERRLPQRCRSEPLMRVPIVLQVPKTSKCRSAEELWKKGRIDAPLVTLPESEGVVKRFRRGLKERGIEWPTTTEANSLEGITAHVAGGAGYGVNVGMSEVVKHPRIRVLPLAGFEPLDVGMIWLGQPGELVAELIEDARSYVRRVWPEWCSPAGG